MLASRFHRIRLDESNAPMPQHTLRAIACGDFGILLVAQFHFPRNI
jgi:hypothetical protein